MRRQRQRTDEAAQRRAQADAIAARVRGPVVSEPVDIAGQVRAEIDRQREAERAEATRLKIARLTGGPCVWCGRTVCAQVEEGGEMSPGWNTVSEGAECGVCSLWRNTSSADEFLDAVACIAIDEGVTGLRRPVRSRFRHEPGLAARVGLVPWRDSGAAPGAAWQHVDVERVRAIANAPDEPVPVRLVDNAEGCAMCGVSRARQWVERKAGLETPPFASGRRGIENPRPVQSCNACETLDRNGAVALLTGLASREGLADELDFTVFADTPGAKPNRDRRWAFIDIDDLRRRAREQYPHDRDWARPAMRQDG